MKRTLLSSTMFVPPIDFPAPASTFCIPEPEPPKDDLLDAIREARRLMMEADADPHTWPREGWFEGRKGVFSLGPVGVQFRAYPEEQG